MAEIAFKRTTVENIEIYVSSKREKEDEINRESRNTYALVVEKGGDYKSTLR